MGAEIACASKPLDATSASMGVNSRKLLRLTRVTSNISSRRCSSSKRCAAPMPAKPPPRITTRTGCLTLWGAARMSAPRPAPARAANASSTPRPPPYMRCAMRLGNRRDAASTDQVGATPSSAGPMVSGPMIHRMSPAMRASVIREACSPRRLSGIACANAPPAAAPMSRCTLSSAPSTRDPSNPSNPRMGTAGTRNTSAAAAPARAPIAAGSRTNRVSRRPARKRRTLRRQGRG